MPIGAPNSLTTCKRFFTAPTLPKHRQYEALRAYFVEDRPSAEVARAFGYTPGSFQVMCHHFRRERDPLFFVSPRFGPRVQPQKSAARARAVELRKRNYSVYEISETLKEEKIALGATAVRELLKAEGFSPLPRRLDEDRPDRPRPTVEATADVRALSLAPRRFTTQDASINRVTEGRHAHGAGARAPRRVKATRIAVWRSLAVSISTAAADVAAIGMAG